jgi:hypothetical protein
MDTKKMIQISSKNQMSDNMKTRKAHFALMAAVWLTGGLLSCSDRSEESEELLVEIIPFPCNTLQADTTIEIRDFSAKLYFHTPRKEEGPACWMPDAGITVVGSSADYCGIGSADSLFNFLGIYLGYKSMVTDHDINMRICNFPDEARSWNRKNLYVGNRCNIWEGEVDIILSGIIYANYHEGVTVADQLELTSLRKIKTRTK